MIDDLAVDEFIQPIINLYQKIEYELLLEVAKRFDGYDEITGTLEWQLKKLQELGALNKQALNVFDKYSEKSEKEIKRMLEQAGLMNLDIEVMQEAFEQGVLTIDPTEIMQSQAIKSTIEQSYKSINQTFRMIKTKALESTRQAYINTLNQAYLETASGMYDGQTAIRRAVQTLASNGIQGATYKRGNKYVRYSIEGTVRRDVITAVHQLSNNVTIQSCDEMNVEYVEVSQHIGARVHPTDPIANHYGWQGKVYKINGSEPGYPNLEASTGYPDDILGLGGVNCRHRMFPFWKGISTPNPIKYDEEENKRIYEARQHQRKLERDMRLLKKKKACADAIGDTETSKMLQMKIQAKSNELNNWCKVNNLKRDYSRELVSEQIVKNETIEKGYISGSSKIGSNKVDLNYIKSDEYRSKFSKLTDNTKVNEAIRNATSGMLTHRNGTNFEDLYVIDAETGDVVIRQTNALSELTVNLSKEQREMLLNAKANGRKLIGIHNHPTNIMPTGSDYLTSYSRNYEFGLVATHNGELYMYNCNDKFAGRLYDVEVDKYIKAGYNIIEAQKKALLTLKGYDIQCVKK